MCANSNGSTAAATAIAGHGPSSGVIDATHDTASASTLHISTCSVEQLEEPEDTFHDAQEHLARSGPSSLNPSPGPSNAGPNSRVKGVTGDEDAEDAHDSLDATPKQPALKLEVSPWDMPSFSSNACCPIPAQPAALPALTPIVSPAKLKSPVDGAIRRRSSIKDQARRPLDLPSMADITDTHTSPRKTEISDQGAFWRQIKSKFSRRAKEESNPLSARSLPPQELTRQTSARRQGPHGFKSGSSPSKGVDTIHTVWPASANVLQWEKQPVVETEHALVHDPLFQVLAPSIPASTPSGTLECQNTSCTARNSLESSRSTVPSPPLNRRSAESPSTTRTPSLRKLKKRSASIKRRSVSTQSYKLIKPEDLARQLHSFTSANTIPMLVLDLRPSQVFAGCQPRLRGSINVNIPSLLVKRFRQGNFTSFALKSFLPDEDSQHRFEQSCPDGNWHKHRIFIVDEKIDEADLLSSSNTSNAAVLAMALAQKQAEQGIFDNPVTFLRGTLQELVEQSALLSSDLVEHHNKQATKSDIETSAFQKNSTPAEVGITSGRLFSTPTLIPGISPPGSSELGASTPKAFLPMESLESVPLESFPAVSQAKQGPRRLRPLNLKHLNTSSSEQSLDSKLAVPPTPSVSSSPANNLTLQGTCPTPALPPTTLAHVGSSAPSRLPAIIMPDEAQATPKGPASFQVSVIIPGFLYLGPEPLQEEDAEELESIGIKRILNVATECNTQERWHGRFEKIASIPMRDSLAEVNVQERFEEACMLLDDADLHAKPTYVHCKAGKSRSVTITLAYLIHRNHWPLKRAYAHVLDRRSGVSPNIGFVAELMRFEETELGARSRGILGTGLTPAHEKNEEYFVTNRIASAGAVTSDNKLPDPRTPRAARSDLEGRPTVVRHLSFIASTAMGVNPDKPRTRDQRSSTHVARVRDSMPPGLVYAQYNIPSSGSGSDDSA